MFIETPSGDSTEEEDEGQTTLQLEKTNLHSLRKV